MSPDAKALTSPRRSPRREKLTAVPRAYRCQCKRLVFFRNSRCLGCNAELGYEPRLGKVFALTSGAHAGTWLLAGARNAKPQLYRRCANLESPAGCNWLTRAGRSSQPELCISCRLNRTIPDLSVPENGVLWGRFEAAKRRVISYLVILGLPIASRLGQDPEKGLAFDFLRPTEGTPVMTGHNDGIITMNVEEADDSRREQIRSAMQEPYRTLVGHFRHELGHYYWYRLVRDSAWLAPFRELFGDDSADYQAALQRHYEQGPPADWNSRFISAYASVHPWEDWAETWAHYLHMADALSTANSFGLKAQNGDLPFDPFPREALYHPDDAEAPRFLSFLNTWVELTSVVNELSRSMGQPDFYPFALPRAAVAKLQFIHILVHSF